MTKPLLIGTSLLLAAASCQKPAQPSVPDAQTQTTSIPSSQANASPGTAGRVETATAPATPPSAPQRVACTINGVPLPMDDVETLASQRNMAKREALLFLIQAETVAQEARRNGFPAPAGAQRIELASAYLESLYNPETLCSSISTRELKALYESAYKPEWPADVYTGQVVEIRCCPTLDSPCDTQEQKECMAHLDRAIPDFLQLAEKWRKLDKATAKDLVGAQSPYIATDFVFLDWPGIPDEKQTRKRLLDVETRKAIKRLSPGEVSSPLRSSLGLHLVKLTRIRKAITSENPEFQAEGREYLCKKRILNTRQDYVKKLVQYVQVVDGEMKLAP